MSAYTEAWVMGPRSTNFYTRTYAAASPKAVVVFIHGFCEHIGRYSHVHPMFAEHDVTVFAFDLRGFGQTALDKKNKSRDSSYGRTGWTDQMADIKWAIDHVKKEVTGVPVFLMGHSMGGGQVLGFVTETSESGEHTNISCLAGAIVTSPLIALAKPPSKTARWLGSQMSSFAPNMLIPAEVNASHLSHDPTFNDAYTKDPLVGSQGSLRGVRDMLAKGDEIAQTRHKQWPKSIPVLFIHGTEDKVTSHKATQAFHDAIECDQKDIHLFEGGYHELQNEPDGVKEKLVETIVNWIKSHLDTAHPPMSDVALTSPTLPETTKSNL